MVFVMLIDILKGLTSEFRSLSVRINFLEKMILNKFIVVYTRLNEPEKIETLLNQRDIKGISVL